LEDGDAVVIAEMTEEEARELIDGPGWACACIGGESCCVLLYKRAREILGIEEE
jgi:hypothetical protein